MPEITATHAIAVESFMFKSPLVALHAFIIQLFKRKALLFLVLIVFYLIFLQPDAWAAGAPQSAAGFLDQVQAKFSTVMKSWKTVFEKYALAILGSLVLINLVWRIATLLFRGNNFSDIIFEFIRTICILGFFTFLIKDPLDLYKQFTQFCLSIGGELFGSKMTGASDMVSLASNCFLNLFNSMPSPVDPDDGWTDVPAILGKFGVLVLFGLCVAVLGVIMWFLFVLIAIQIMFANITLTFLIYAGMLVLALGGTEWTRSNALNYVTAVIGAGLKLIATLAIANLLYSIVKGYADNPWVFSGGFFAVVREWVLSSMTLCAAAFIGVKMIDFLPSMVAQLVSGLAANSGFSAGGMTAAAGKMALAATGLAAGTMALGRMLQGGSKALGAKLTNGLVGNASGLASGIAGALGGSQNSFMSNFATGKQAAVGKDTEGHATGWFNGTMAALGRATGHDYGQYRNDFSNMGFSGSQAAQAARTAQRLHNAGMSRPAAMRKAADAIEPGRYSQWSSARESAASGGSGNNGVESGGSPAGSEKGNESAPAGGGASDGGQFGSDYRNSVHNAWQGMKNAMRQETGLGGGGSGGQMSSAPNAAYASSSSTRGDYEKMNGENGYTNMRTPGKGAVDESPVSDKNLNDDKVQRPGNIR